MSVPLILLRQVAVMFLLAAVGFAAFRSGKITSEGAGNIGNILIYVSLPAVIIKSFMVERTPAGTTGLLISVALSAAALALCILLSRLIFRRDPIASFGASFSNPGFFGIPLITAALGAGAVFYIAPFVAMLNLLQWSYGVWVLTGSRNSVTVRSVLTAPFMAAIMAGLVLFFTGLRLPSVVTGAIDFCAGLNTPLAMFTVGVYVSQCRFGEAVRNGTLYAVSAVRLLLIPAVVLLLLSLMPGVDRDVRLAVLIASASPVGSNLAVYAQLHGKDYTYAVETVAFSTIFCIATVPLVVKAAELIWT